MPHEAFNSMISGDIINSFTFLYLLPTTEPGILYGVSKYFNMLVYCAHYMGIYIDNEHSKKLL